MQKHGPSYCLCYTNQAPEHLQFIISSGCGQFISGCLFLIVSLILHNAAFTFSSWEKDWLFLLPLVDLQVFFFFNRPLLFKHGKSQIWHAGKEMYFKTGPNRVINIFMSPLKMWNKTEFKDAAQSGRVITQNSSFLSLEENEKTHSWNFSVVIIKEGKV